MITLGSGPPVLLIPGVQGRWEWMRPAVEALAQRCRVVTCSLCGEPRTGRRVDPARGFRSFVAQTDDLFERAGLERATLCGVSFGGLVALHYAACRPERVSALVLVSTPAPSWRPNCRVEMYLRAPRLLSPLLVLSSPFRLYPEISTAFPRWRPRLAFSAQHLWRVAVNPFSPVRMAERVRLMAAVDFSTDCAAVRAPTLVVTGERGLDRVVPVDSTCEYLAAIRGARHVTIERTGHIGLITRPYRFAEIIAGFAREHQGDAVHRRRA